MMTARKGDEGMGGWGGGRGVTFGERSGFEPKLSHSLEVQPPKSKGLFLPILLLSD